MKTKIIIDALAVALSTSANPNFKEWFHSQVDKIKREKEQAK